jgi:hypothetical protein
MNDVARWFMSEMAAAESAGLARSRGS